MTGALWIFVGLLAVVPPELLDAPPRVVHAEAPPGTTRAVPVALTIGADGAVSDVQITAEDGPWGPAVVQAVTALRFKPATQDGAPVAVRIAWSVPVDGPPPPPPPEPVGVAIQGQVVERGTRRPLAGIPVQLVGHEASGISDAEGRFVIEDAPPGPGVLEVPTLDHEGLTQPVTAPAADVVLRLTPRAGARYESVGRLATADATRVAVTAQQASQVAGSAGDPLKVIQSLPGVARNSSLSFDGRPVVRGSQPEDTKIYVDGLNIPSLYHFGGLYSVLPDAFLGDLVFRPGGFSAAYGDGQGGIVDVTLKPLAQDGVHGNLDVNVYHAAALVSAPVSRSWTVAAAARRSYVDAFIGAVADGVSFNTAPRYWDYQLRGDYRPNRRLQVRLMVFGSSDALALITDDPPDGDPNLRAISTELVWHRAQGSYRWALSPAVTLSGGLYLDTATNQNRIGDDAFLDLTFRTLGTRQTVALRLADTLSLRTGVMGRLAPFDIAANFPTPPKEGELPGPFSGMDRVVTDDQGYTGQAAAWAEVEWQALAPLTLVAGVHGHAWLGSLDDGAVDPRLTVRWQAAQGTTVTAQAGLYTQEPDVQESHKDYGNPAVDPERSAQTSLGVRQAFGDGLSVELTGFYKRLWDQVSPAAPGEPVNAYTNDGEGDAVGAELLVRGQSRWVDGWLSYTLSRSRRTDRPGEPERPFSFDQPHVLTAVLGVNLGAGWRIGGRARYASGNPDTRLKPGYYDANTDVFVPSRDGEVLGSRLPGFFQLDLRVDKTFTFDDWVLGVYAEAQNATLHENVEAVGYSYDFSRQQNITGLPILPSVGIRGTF